MEMFEIYASKIAVFLKLSRKGKIGILNRDGLYRTLFTRRLAGLKVLIYIQERTSESNVIGIFLLACPSVLIILETWMVMLSRC